MKVTVSMVVRDEEIFLPYALRSALPIAGEYCIVDNGSQDGTIHVIQGFQAEYGVPVRIRHLPDCDDLALMWNASMEDACYEFCLFLAGDEVLYNDGVNDVNVIVQTAYRMAWADPDFNGVLMPFYHFMGSHHYTVVGHVHPGVKMLRNDGSVRWEYPEGMRVHEAPAGIKGNLESYAHFAHYGYIKPAHLLRQKGKDYEQRGWPNDLWKAEHTLVGCEVAPFSGEHPQVMDDFPWEKYDATVELQDGKYRITEKP